MRPRRVIVLDADNPLVEIPAEFVWLEDHDRLVAQARAGAFEIGFAAGLRRAGSGGRGIRVRGVGAGWSVSRVLVLAPMVLVVVAYLICLLVA